MNFKLLMLNLNMKVVKEHANDNITILFWNFFWEIDRMGEGNSGFVKNKCKYTNCFTTNNRSELYLPGKRVCTESQTPHFMAGISCSDDIVKFSQTQANRAYFRKKHN